MNRLNEFLEVTPIEGILVVLSMLYFADYLIKIMVADLIKGSVVWGRFYVRRNLIGSKLEFVYWFVFWVLPLSYVLLLVMYLIRLLYRKLLWFYRLPIK